MAKFNLLNEKQKKLVKMAALSAVLLCAAGLTILQMIPKQAYADTMDHAQVKEIPTNPTPELPEGVTIEENKSEPASEIEKEQATVQKEAVQTIVQFTVTEKPHSQTIDGNVCVDIPVANITGERGMLHFTYPQALEDNKAMQVVIDNLDIEHMAPGSTLDFEVDSEKFGQGFQLYATAQTDFVKNALRGTNQDKINKGSILEVDLGQVISSIGERETNFMTTIKLAKMTIVRDQTVSREQLNALEQQYIDEHPFVSEEDNKYADQETVEEIREEKKEEQKKEMDEIEKKKTSIDKEMEEKAKKQIEEQKEAEKKGEDKSAPKSDVIVDAKTDDKKEQPKEDPSKKKEEEKKEEKPSSEITAEISEDGTETKEEDGSSTKQIDGVDEEELIPDGFEM